jgi:hypothetical protein
MDDESFEDFEERMRREWLAGRAGQIYEEVSAMFRDFSHEHRE